MYENDRVLVKSGNYYFMFFITPVYDTFPSIIFFLAFESSFSLFCQSLLKLKNNKDIDSYVLGPVGWKNPATTTTATFIDQLSDSIVWLLQSTELIFSSYLSHIHGVEVRTYVLLHKVYQSLLSLFSPYLVRQ